MLTLTKPTFLFTSIVFSIWILTLCAQSMAAEIEFKEEDNGPFGRSTVLNIVGPIEDGDFEKVKGKLNPIKWSPKLSLHVNLASQGGSLVEGILIAEYFQKLPIPVTINVNRSGERAECASACVLIYLGGTYRFLKKGSKIGVHQFYLSDSSDVSADAGVASAQLLSAEIIRVIKAANVSEELFYKMTSVQPSEIRWLVDEELREMNVVNEHIYSQVSEFKHAEGFHYLLLWQQSYYGENKLLVSCLDNKDLFFISYIQPLDIELFNPQGFEFEFLVDEEAYQPSEIVEQTKDARWGITAFGLPASLSSKLAKARSIGVRHRLKDLGLFFGFSFNLMDDKFTDLTRDCSRKKSNESDSTAFSQYIPRLDTDFRGGDIDNKGVKGVSFENCVKMCELIDQCVGISWVQKNSWCWPKHTISGSISTPGVVSMRLSN